jgi:predicted transcriptional regulator
MNTTKSVYNRLFSEDKVELASERVELATIKELENSFKALTLPFADMNKAQTSVSSVQSVLRKLEADLNDKIKEAIDVDKKAKELGLDSGILPFVDMAKAKLKDIAALNGIFARFAADVEKYK